MDEMASSGAGGGGMAGGAPPEVLLRAAERKLKQGHGGEAAAIYAGLVSGGAVDEDVRNTALAGLVTAKCRGGEAEDVAGAEAHAEKLLAALLAASGSTKAPDAEILEETPPASVAARAVDLERRSGRKREGRSGGGGGGEDGAGKAKKRKRKKKTILPKGFDAAKPPPPPDPERWLPLRERASFRWGQLYKLNPVDLTHSA